MFCSKCGKENSDGAKFCGYCGEKMGISPEVFPEIREIKKTKENILDNNFQYAGFWRRFFAVFLDGILLTLLFFVPFLAYAYVKESEVFKELFAINPFLLLKWFQLKQVENPYLILLMSFTGLIYHAVMESSAKQATFGKMALGIIVTDQNGERITFARAAGRHLGKIVSSLLLFIGFLMAAFTKRKQALHDIMANCLVVKKIETTKKASSNDNKKTDVQEKHEADSASMAQTENKTEIVPPVKKSSTFKKIVIAIIIVVLITGAGYFVWNKYNLSRLSGQLKQAESNISVYGDSSNLVSSIESLPLIYNNAVLTSMPFFLKEYVEIGYKTVTLLTVSPVRVAEWVKAKRSNAWSAIGAEQSIREEVDDKDLVSAVNSLKNICETAILAEKNIMESAHKMSVRLDSLEGISDLDREIKLTAEQAERIAQVGAEIARIKGDARSEIQKGLRQIDEANREIEKYAEVSVLQKACNDWEVAMSTIQNASAILNNIPSFEVGYQNRLARALVKSDQEKIKEMIEKITPHVAHAREELAKAEQQESNAIGQAQRTIGRWVERAKNSRIGQEIAVSLKGLVLGTKMFYDMMGMDSNTDLSSWAQRYESDMNKLIQDMDRIKHMKGWSLTGKNTFVEDAVNKAYEKSFKQPTPNTEKQDTPVHQEAHPYNETQSTQVKAVGNPAQAPGDGVSSKDSVEHKAPVKVKQITGDVLSINRSSNTITVRGKKGDVVIKCDNSTRIMVGKDAGTLGDIRNGDKIVVKYFEQESVNTAKSVTLKEKGGFSDNIILHEDFDSSSVLDFNKWILWQESRSSSKPFIDSKGNPGNSLNGGDRCSHMCGNWLYYNKDIPYQQGLVIEFDFWCAGSGWHYTDAVVGLTSNRGGEPKAIIVLHASKNDGLNQMVTEINRHRIEGVAKYRPNTWHSGKIVILKDRSAEFYLDGQLIQRSNEKIVDIGKPATLFVLSRSVNGPAYIDNIKVWVP